MKLKTKTFTPARVPETHTLKKRHSYTPSARSLGSLAHKATYAAGRAKRYK